MQSSLVYTRNNRCISRNITGTWEKSGIPIDRRYKESKATRCDAHFKNTTRIIISFAKFNTFLIVQVLRSGWICWCRKDILLTVNLTEIVCIDFTPFISIVSNVFVELNKRLEFRKKRLRNSIWSDKKLQILFGLSWKGERRASENFYLKETFTRLAYLEVLIL